MAEYTLLRKLEVLWGIPIFYTDETGKDVRGVGVFSEKQNPLTISGELVNALICQAKEQDVPAICKVFARSNFFWCSERTGILSVRSRMRGTAQLRGNTPVLQEISYAC